MFFNEVDLLRIHHTYLKDIVDYIVVIESSQTFAGNYKNIFFFIQFDPGSSSALKSSRFQWRYCHSFDDLVCQLRGSKVSTSPRMNV